jgi:hypothetical protein
MSEETALVTQQDARQLLQPLPEAIEEALVGGNLAALSVELRNVYYKHVCQSLGLNPLTKPFEYLVLNNKLVLYATKNCTEQIRKIHGISLYITSREKMADIYVVTARAKDREGREDESTGAVTLGTLKGDALCNALMKAETKAKRRATLSIAGLGMLDETEIETIPAQAKGDPGEADGTTVEGKQRPSADDISTLVELAHAAGVTDAAFADEMRKLMDLPEGTRITKKFLRETMTPEQYRQANRHYGEKVGERAMEDVPDFPPPKPQASEPEGVLETVEIQGETVEVELQPPAEERAAESKPVASTDDRVTLDSPQVKALLAEAEGFVKIQHDLRETVNRVGGISAKAFKDSEGNFRNRIAKAKRAHEEAKQRAQGTLV